MLIDCCSCYWTIGDSQQINLWRKLSSLACLSPPVSRMNCNETKCKKNERGVEQGKARSGDGIYCVESQLRRADKRRGKKSRL